jgi:hypothetical protein
MLLAAYFYEYDKDRSGKLDYKEFKKLMNKMCRLEVYDSDSSDDSFEIIYYSR